MSAIADITVFDGAATPVSHTLKAISVTQEKGKVVALWRENLASVPAYAQVRAQLTLEELKSGVVRSELRVEVPVMESIAGNNASGYTAAPKVAFTDTHVAIGYHHPRSTITSRRLARQILTNLLGNAGWSVEPEVDGPVPEAIDQLISPT